MRMLISQKIKEVLKKRLKEQNVKNFSDQELEKCFSNYNLKDFCVKTTKTLIAQKKITKQDLT